MIFRRLAQHLKEQNWTAIFIEFVLLVLGVYLGMQVNNWNENRGDADRGRAYVARIRANMSSDLFNIDHREAFWRQVQAYGQSAAHYAETGELVQGSAWKTVLSFYQASQVWPWTPIDTTYEELRSAGELGLVNDERLRDALDSYYFEGGGPDTAYFMRLIPEYRKIVRGLTPALVSDHVWSKCWRQPNYREQILIDCESPMTEAQAQQVLDGYVNDPDLLRELRFWVTTQGVALNLLGINRTAVQTMLARTQELEKP